MLLIFFVGTLSAQTDPAYRHYKLPGSFTKFDFEVWNGDTIVHAYQREMKTVENGDSVLYVEFYDAGKKWYLNRYRIAGGKTSLNGWQKEFDERGIIREEKLCPGGKKKCNYTRQYAYYPGGELMSVGYFYKTDPDNYHYYFYSNGQLRELVEFDKGKFMNVLAYYDEDGNPLDPGNFCDGEGSVNIYSMNGKLIQIKVFHKGKIKKIITISAPEN